MFTNARLRIAAALATALAAIRGSGPAIPQARAPGMGRRRNVPAKSYGGWRLLWDSSRGTAYKVLDPKTKRMIYVPLRSVPIAMRQPRRERRTGFII